MGLGGLTDDPGHIHIMQSLPIHLFVTLHNVDDQRLFFIDIEGCYDFADAVVFKQVVKVLPADPDVALLVVV